MSFKLRGFNNLRLLACLCDLKKKTHISEKKKKNILRVNIINMNE